MQIPVVKPPVIHIKKTLKKGLILAAAVRARCSFNSSHPGLGKSHVFCTEVLAAAFLHPIFIP